MNSVCNYSSESFYISFRTSYQAVLMKISEQFYSLVTKQVDEQYHSTSFQN